MSREFTRGSFDELTKKSSKAFCPFKDFQSDQIRRHSRKIKYSLLITHAKNVDLNLARLMVHFLNNQFINRILGRGGGYACPTLTVFVNCKLFLLNFFFCLHCPSLNSLVSCGQYFCFIMWFFIKFCCCCFSWCPWMTSYYLITSWTSLILLPGLFFIIQHLKQLGTGSFYF